MYTLYTHMLLDISSYTLMYTHMHTAHARKHALHNTLVPALGCVFMHMHAVPL